MLTVDSSCGSLGAATTHMIMNLKKNSYLEGHKLSQLPAHLRTEIFWIRRLQSNQQRLKKLLEIAKYNH